MTRPIITDPTEREALLGLWAAPGLGRAQLEHLLEATGGRLSSLLDVPTADWVHDLKLGPEPRDFLERLPSLAFLSEQVRNCARFMKQQIAFEGDADYPENLALVEDRPPVLFRVGRIGAPRKRVAMVGSRKPEGGFTDRAYLFAQEIARAGVGVISGGAFGIDRKCHEGALDAEGETWAFFACSLDRLDPPQRELAGRICRSGGAVFTEYPPRTPTRPEFYPRRNRLISGSADAVIVLRAAKDSGTMHTADHARAQGRRLLAMPGDPSLGCCEASNELIHSGQARMCLSVEDVWSALSLVPERMGCPPPPGRPLKGLGLSDQAKRALGALSRETKVFEELLEKTRLAPGQLLAALSELQLAGVAIQHPGKAYERV